MYCVDSGHVTLYSSFRSVKTGHMRSHKSSSKNYLVKKPLCITNYLHWSIRPKSKKRETKIIKQGKESKTCFHICSNFGIETQLFTRQINETGAFTIDIAFGIIKDIKQYLSTNIKNSTKENKFHEKTVRKIKRERYDRNEHFYKDNQCMCTY